MRGLSDKVAIVTGGAQGIGRSTVDRLVVEGASVVIADTEEDLGAAAVRELNESRDRAIFVRTDVSDEREVRAAVERSMEAYGRIDFLVNCAAVFIMRGLEARVEQWLKVFSVNIIGQSLFAKYATPHMCERGSGAIVNVSSVSAHVAQPSSMTYSATKAAILGMTRCMAMDLASQGVRVNSVSPGIIWTANNAEYHARELGIDRPHADSDQQIGGLHMLKRVGDPHEVASAITFLLSDEASFITGADLMVDGGYSAM